MSTKIIGVESTAKEVLPYERDDYHVYIRTNISKIDTDDIDEIPGNHCWKYDEEILTHTEYMLRLEEQLSAQKEANISAMVGLAELYESLYPEEEV